MRRAGRRIAIAPVANAQKIVAIWDARLAVFLMPPVLEGGR